MKVCFLFRISFIFLLLVSSLNLIYSQNWNTEIEFDEAAFNDDGTLVSVNAGTLSFTKDYDILEKSGKTYTEGTDGTDDLRVTATIVTSATTPGWTQIEGDLESSAWASDYTIALGQSRPNDCAYVKFDFEFINGLAITANAFATRHTSANGSSEAYEWTLVTVNGASINESNICNYTNTNYDNGMSISQFLLSMAASSPSGGNVAMGIWAADDFNTMTQADPEEDQIEGDGSISDNQNIGGSLNVDSKVSNDPTDTAVDGTDDSFGLSDNTLITQVTYYFGVNDIGFDFDGDGFSGTNTSPSARIGAFDIGFCCATEFTAGTPACSSDNTTYSVDLAFTGAGSGTYTISPNAGSVSASSDDPEMDATGTVTIENIAVGTDLSFDITNSIGCCIAIAVTSPSCGAKCDGKITIYEQDFEFVGDPAAVHHSFFIHGTPNPDTAPNTCNNNEDVVDFVNSVGDAPDAITPSSGSRFLGFRDVQSTPCTSNGEVTFTTDIFRVPSDCAGQYEICFDYYVFGFDTNDHMDYTVLVNGSGGSVDLIPVGAGPKSTAGWVTINETVTVAAGQTLQLEIFVDQDGGPDWAGIDNISICGPFSCPAPTDIEVFPGGGE